MSELKSNKPSLVVFVHGFDSSTDCWTQLRGLLDMNERVTSRFDLALFSYRTGVVALTERLPSLPEVAGKLDDFMRDWASRGYRDITLVGHSMGGLVIQAYITALLDARRGAELSPLRQVILFATPNLGSMTLADTRRLLGYLLPNPQEERLRVFDAEVSAMQTKIAEKVIDAKERGPGQFPVPFVCFYGEKDNYVPEPSVRGRFDNVQGLPGDHFSLIRPAHLKDPCYTQFVEYLFEPAGHRNYFEVEEWGVSVKVEPRDPAKPVEAVHGRKRRQVFTDNYARLARWVKFSRRNRCDAKFELSFKTLGGGWVEYTTSHPNEIGPQEKRDYDGDGFNARFWFTPRVADDGGPAPDAGEEYRLDVNVYKSFDEGKRDLHFHLADYDCIYHKIFFRLDLSAYLSAGYEVTDEPKFYLRDGPNECDPSSERELGEARPPQPRDARAPRSVWEWEIDGASGGIIRDGVIDVRWDVAQKSR